MLLAGGMSRVQLLLNETASFWQEKAEGMAYVLF